MSRIDNALYLEDVTWVADLDLPWEDLRNKTILLSGATGMIGSFMIDVLVRKDINCSILALTRSAEKARKRATPAWADAVRFVEWDINQRQMLGFREQIAYVIHAASNTHPVAYATDPIGTIVANITGTQQMLELAAAHHAKRAAFISSVEIYGQNRGDCERFTEQYCGYIDCNTLRAGYPEGKRAGEALCQAYIRQKGLDVVIPRLPRVYGPTVLPSDSKAISQFLKKGVRGEDIVLKSDGTQVYSYGYVADAVAGILYCLLLGKNGEAYNIGDSSSDITLKDLAALIAEHVGSEVVFELPDDTESAGYSRATMALLDGSKLKNLGWSMHYSIAQGIPRTIEILKDSRVCLL